MGKDVKLMISTMQVRLGPDSMKEAIILGFCALFIGTMTTFLIVLLTRYRLTDDDLAALNKHEEAAKSGTQNLQNVETEMKPLSQK